jgi:hypothetical protein
MLQRSSAYAKEVTDAIAQHWQNGVFYGKKIICKIYTYCAQRFARFVPVYKKGHTLVCKSCTVISFICTCKMFSVIDFYYDYLYQVNIFYTNVHLW